MSVLTVTKLTDSGSGSLREVIKLAQKGDTIQFAADLAGQTIVLTSGQITIDPGKNLTIDGSNASGLKISGNNNSRIFLVNSNGDKPTNLSLKNLALIQGYTPETGGAIQVAHKGELTVENVVFRNNVSQQGGGAIYSAWETNLTAINSRFVENIAIADNEETSGGAISFISPGKITVTGSNFVRNRGINGGAINSLRGKLTIEDSRFISNDTTAAYYATNSLHPTIRGYGGAVYTDRASFDDPLGGTIKISNSVFKNNKALGQGGAAYFYTDPDDTVIVDRSLFENNEVKPLAGGSPGNGGAIFQVTTGTNRGLTISNSAFFNNRAYSQGGGLWMKGAPTNILNSTFSRNVVSGDETSRGGAMMLYSDTTIDNTTIAYNEVDWFGGGIYKDPKINVSVSDSIFYYNKGNNIYGNRNHVHTPLIDKGGNFQYPPETDSTYNATNKIRTDVDVKLGPRETDGIVPYLPVNNPIAAGAGANPINSVASVSIFNNSEPVNIAPVNTSSDLSSSEINLVNNPLDDKDSLLNQDQGYSLSQQTALNSQRDPLTISPENTIALEHLPTLEEQFLLSSTQNLNGLLNKPWSERSSSPFSASESLLIDSSSASEF